MGDFATTADIVAAAQNAAHVGCQQILVKANVTTVSGFYYSGWLATGVPAPGVAPGAAATPTDNTVGALNFAMRAPASGGTLRLLEWSFFQGSATIPGSILYDRLAHNGGMSTIVTGVQSTNLPCSIATAAADGRCKTDGTDVEWFVEVFAAGGATSSVSMTVSYTNQAGTAGQTSQTITLAASGWPASRLYPIFPAAADTGIKSIESININTSSGTAGSIGVVAAKRLTMIRWNNGQFDGRNGGNNFPGGNDALALFMPQIPTNACLWEVLYASGTSFAPRYGELLIGGRP